ncbi:MAG: helix-turn-helix domain-containing protein, partial [Streptosporangiaceae bacterium]
MSIGETLAEARRQAGLSVDQLSRQTRIRGTIIRGIEQDDYSACGGDFYTRGHIRAMARAIGADPAPLIREYDETARELNGLEANADGTGNVRFSVSPGGPGPAASAPNVFEPIRRPPAQPDTPSPPTVFAPTHEPDAAYPAPSVFDAVDQVFPEPAYEPPAAYEAPDTYEPPAAYEAPAAYKPPPISYEAPADYEPLDDYEDSSGYAEPAGDEPAGYETPGYETPGYEAPAYEPPPPMALEPPRRPARPPAREPGVPWISSLFDAAEEDPAESTQPNASRTAITFGGTRPPRRENRVAIIAVAVLAVVGLLAYLLTNVFSSSPAAKPSASATQTAR